jgi:hypothetical protein
MKFYTGVVENREDPLKIGRCQVRIVGLHTENKTKSRRDESKRNLLNRRRDVRNMMNRHQYL